MPATFRVEITPAAEADVAGIWDYVAQDAHGNATVFVLALEEQVASLYRYPERCTRIPENEVEPPAVT